MPKKGKNLNKKNKQVWAVMAIVILMLALIVALVTGLIKQAKTISQYELISHLDNQACRYLSDRGDSSQVGGGFALNSDASKDEYKIEYYCYTGENTTSKTIHGKSIDGYPFGATVLYFSNNESAEAYAKEKLNPLRYWGENGGNYIQNKNYTFLVTDEKAPYFDAYRVRANAVVRVSMPCKSTNFEACDMQANQLLDQELKGINDL